MTAAVIVAAAVAGGIRIRIDGDRVVLSASRRPNKRLIEDLRSAKTEVIRYLDGLALWTEHDWSAFYEERAAIMEYDGGLVRAEAMTRAAKELNQLRSVARSGDG